MHTFAQQTNKYDQEATNSMPSSRSKANIG